MSHGPSAKDGEKTKYVLEDSTGRLPSTITAIAAETLLPPFRSLADVLRSPESRREYKMSQSMQGSSRARRGGLMEGVIRLITAFSYRGQATP